MKRRTRPDPRGPLTDHHRLAFEHARRVMGLKDPQRLVNRQRKSRVSGLVVSFEISLQCEPDHRSLSVELSCTRGFRVRLNNQLWVQRGEGDAERKRFLPYRLQAYRERLTWWQKTVNHPFTFRDFNLLLAALSYDVEANL